MMISGDSAIQEAFTIARETLKMKEPITSQFVPPGLSGSVLVKLSSPSGAYVVRFWNRQWPSYYSQDLAAQLIAAEAGYGPKVFFSDTAACVTVMEYLQQESLSSELRLPALVALVKRMHAGPLFPQGLDRAFEMEETIKDVVIVAPSLIDADKYRAWSRNLFAVLRNISGAPVPCHRDLNPGNTLYVGGRFFAIDYTWAGMSDPYADLAGLALFECATPEEEKKLLTLYLERSPTAAECAKLALHVMVDKLMYGLAFLSSIPAHAVGEMRSTPVSSRSYRNFGRAGRAATVPELFEYASLLLADVDIYMSDGQFDRDCGRADFKISGENYEI